jgi:hypothetical protein
MLSRFDDYPIHHTPEPIAHRAGSDPNAYGARAPGPQAKACS